MNNYTKIEKFLEEQGIFDIIGDDQKLESYIQNLTADKFTNLMININKNLRSIEDDKDCLDTRNGSW